MCLWGCRRRRDASGVLGAIGAGWCSAGSEMGLSVPITGWEKVPCQSCREVWRMRIWGTKLGVAGSVAVARARLPQNVERVERSWDRGSSATGATTNRLMLAARRLKRPAKGKPARVSSEGCETWGELWNHHHHTPQTSSCWLSVPSNSHAFRALVRYFIFSFFSLLLGSALQPWAAPSLASRTNRFLSVSPFFSTNTYPAETSIDPSIPRAQC